MFNIKSEDYRDVDWPLFVFGVLIFGIGLLALYSASFGRLTDLPFKQSVWMLMGVFLFFFLHRSGYRRVIDSAYLIYSIGIVLLLFVLVLGSTKLGAQRWIYVGPFSLQPSEFMKFFYIFALVRYSSHIDSDRLDVVDMFLMFLLTALPMGLILIEPDLGTSLVFLPILFAVLYVKGTNIKFFIVSAVLGLVSTPFLWMHLKDYQKSRLVTFLNPNADPLGAGYTMIQSKIAIGSGGFFGKGWLSGTQNILNFLPERHSDFIFSVVGEEFGFFGVLLTILLFFLMLWRILSLTMASRDKQARFLGTGVFVLILFQTSVNLGMSMGIMPVVGLPLPFMSYGGSSLLLNMASLGVVSSFRKSK